MKKKIYIVRHGEKVKIPGDPPLSETGQKQAKKTAEYLKLFPIKIVACSPILRAKETAQYIAEATGISIEISELLKERVNWGDNPNQSFEDFLSMWRKSSKERTWQPPVGDSSRGAGERLLKALQDPRYSDFDNLVFVTHGGIITDFLRNVFTTEYLNNFVSNFEDKLEESIKECSVTTLQISDDPNNKFDLIEYASTSHLVNL